MSIEKLASLGRQEPQSAGTTKWATTLRFGKILGTTSKSKDQYITDNGYFSMMAPLDL